MTQKNKIKRRKAFSIRSRVFGFLALFTAIILVVLWLFQTVFLDDIYKAVKMHDLQKCAFDITDMLNTAALEVKTETIARENELCIIVQDPQGKIIISTEALHNCVIHHISYRDRSRLYLDAKNANGTDLERFRLNTDTGIFESVNDQETTSEENIILTKCVTDKNGNEYVIFINSILTPVNATIKTLNTILGFISIGLLFVALIMSFLISVGITRPIKKLTSSATELAHGNYDVVFPLSKAKEINTLSDTLNYASTELKKNEALKKELIANISHDLRTPLTLITGYSEAMRDIPDEMTAENLQIVINESKRLSSLVNDLMDVSKLQSGTIMLSPETFDMSELLRETASHYQRLVDQNGYTITLKAEEKANVTADRKKILQVIYNLVNNAVTHTGSDKNITISMTRVMRFNVSYVRVEVSDTGEGIEPDNLPLIWDRYYKVDKFHKRDQMGSGLGLSIVKSIIELHSGYYGVFSTVGHGSTFWFELQET